MENKTLFKIKDLRCAYNGGEVVLEIDHLEIPRGELVVLLGTSGSGKSTFLETLGLMNNTIKDGEVLFYPKLDNPEFNDFRNVWEDTKENKNIRDKIRGKYFSFIFQDTYLMPNFSIYENIRISQLIGQLKNKGNKTKGNSEIMELIRKVKLSNVTNQQKVYELSGGQRQRVAFIRSLAKDFEVLFCDEPTGNLDEILSDELISQLKELTEKEKKSVILVSHDIHLSQKYADRIIILKSPEKEYCPGRISQADVLLPYKSDEYSSKVWLKRHSDEITDHDIFSNPEKCILDKKVEVINDNNLIHLLNSNENNNGIRFNVSEVQIKNFYNPLSRFLETPVEFTQTFFRNEFNALKGKNYLNVIVLFNILLLTFLAIGFAMGSLDYLDKKMKDPFIKEVNVDIPYSISKRVSDQISLLNEDTIKKRYHIDNITGFNKIGLTFISKIDSSDYTEIGRTIDVESPIVEKIVSEEMLINGRKFYGSKDMGIIIKEDVFRKLGYKKTDPFIYSKVMVNDTFSIWYPYPIIAVVKDLPGYSSFVITNYMYEQRQMPGSESPFYLAKEKDLYLYLIGSRNKAADFEKALKKYFKNGVWITPPSEYSNFTHYSPAYLFKIPVNKSNSPLESIENTYKDIINSDEFSDYEIYKIFDFKSRAKDQILSESYDYFAINFNELSNVRDFKTFLERNFKIDIDLAKIEAAENYNFVSQLTKIISILLIAFSLLSVTMFSSHLLYSHLNKIRINIGTFKAFGMPNNVLKSIYLTLANGFVIIAMLFSILIATGVGYAGGIRNILKLFGNSVENEVAYFDIWNAYVLISIILIIIVSIIVLTYTANKILNKTPGNLIYGRD